MTLPDCMMPDGADPCEGYAALEKFIQFAERRSRIADEAAAFLDKLAERLKGTEDLEVIDKAYADCRAMAAKLRGDNG